MTRRKMASWLAVLMAVAVVALDARPAAAQRGRGFRRMFASVSKAQLASLPEVQAELKLSDEQQASIAKINDELGEKRRAVWGTGFGKLREMRGKIDALNSEAATAVDALLDPAQRKRLQEITIQQNGARALLDRDVAAALGLTEAQQTQLAAAREENGRAFEEALADSSREEAWQRMGDLSEQADKRLMAVLTDAQRATLKELAGAELTIDRSQLFRGGGR